MSHSHRRWHAVLVTLAIAALGCEEKTKDQLYFKDLEPIAGVKVKIVTDVNKNLPTGGTISVASAVDPNIDKDDLERLARYYLRQAGERQGFKNGSADEIDLRFYDSDAKAQAGGADFLAQIKRTGREGKPVFTNRQKPPLLKWAKAALGKQPQYTGSLQPQLLADPTALSVEATVPFINEDGTGQYVEKVSFTKATTELSFYMRTLFDKIEELKRVTFIGKHKDSVLVKIWMTREQYDELNLRQVEESLGAFQGKYIAALMSKAISEKVVKAKVDAQRKKVYRETLARLPAKQVEFDKSIK
ncbi:MAG: hypothetical protein IT371_26800 [Deltaproteobacteria bacterium]|nr:hypothetical protein [Deltaproteobacteria bacterium]